MSVSIRAVSSQNPMNDEESYSQTRDPPQAPTLANRSVCSVCSSRDGYVRRVALWMAEVVYRYFKQLYEWVFEKPLPELKILEWPIFQGLPQVESPASS